MGIKKISTNKLKTLIKQIIKEEHEQSEMEKIVSHVLYNNFVDYVLDSSFKKDEYDEYVEYEFSMLIPKGDEIIYGLSNPIEVQRFFQEEHGVRTYSGPGGSFSKTRYNVKDKGKNISVSVIFKMGYDI